MTTPPKKPLPHHAKNWTYHAGEEDVNQPREPIPAPEGEVPTRADRIWIRGADANDLPFDWPGQYEYRFVTKEMDKFTVPYVPEAALSAEKQRGLRAVEEAIREFTAQILHGDAPHRAWLVDASEKFIESRAAKEPS